MQPTDINDPQNNVLTILRSWTINTFCIIYWDNIIIFSHLASQLCVQWCQWLRRRRRRFRFLYLYNNVEIILILAVSYSLLDYSGAQYGLPTLNLTKLETEHGRFFVLRWGPDSPITTCGLSCLPIFGFSSSYWVSRWFHRWTLGGILGCRSKHALPPVILFGRWW